MSVRICRKEQDELKHEMEKMSELIAELRENCQKLQTELLESKNNFGGGPMASVGVQVSLLQEQKAAVARRASSSSITSESVKKASRVYGSKQPKPRYHSSGQALSNSSSVSSLHGPAAAAASSQPAAAPTSAPPARTTRTVSLSPMKRSSATTMTNKQKTTSALALNATATAGRTHQSLRNGGNTSMLYEPIILS